MLFIHTTLLAFQLRPKNCQNEKLLGSDKLRLLHSEAEIHEEMKTCVSTFMDINKNEMWKIIQQSYTKK